MDLQIHVSHTGISLEYTGDQSGLVGRAVMGEEDQTSRRKVKESVSQEAMLQRAKGICNCRIWDIWENRDAGTRFKVYGGVNVMA